MAPVSDRIATLRREIAAHSRWAWLLGGVFALAFPALAGFNGYVCHVGVLALLYAVLALGLNVVPGFTGLLDLGYVGFYAVGAYTAGLLALKTGMSFWLALPLAALHGALWGVLRGAPTLRLTGDYFAIVTFGFSELVVMVAKNETWLTRGPMGLPGIEPPSALGIPFRGEIPFYYLLLAIVGVLIVLLRRIAGSRVGRAWFAIREDEVAAEACGVNVARYKVLAFALSAGIGATAGAFYAHWITFISPGTFQFWESVLVLCMLVLGGMGSIPGVVFGAVVLIALGEVLRGALGHLGLPEDTRFLFFGIVMILMMRFRPEGLIRGRGDSCPS
jgi:branched-chain amino acid transport system permease protein